MSDPDNGSYEMLFQLTARINVPFTPAMKEALHSLSRRHHISVADIIRQAVDIAMPQIYPEYQSVYQEILERDVNNLRKDNEHARKI